MAGSSKYLSLMKRMYFTPAWMLLSTLCMFLMLTFLWLPCASAAPPSSKPCWRGMWSLAWVTFTRLRPCSLQAYIQRAPLAMWRCHASRPCIRSSGCCWRRRFRWAAQPSRTSKTHRESTACFKTHLRSMGERPSPAKCVPDPLDASYKDSAQRITAWGASGERHAAWS